MRHAPKTVLLLGASRYHVRTIESIRGYGYQVLAIDRNPQAEGFKFADGFAAIDITDEEGATAFAERNKVDGILAVSDFGVRTAAYVSERLGLPGLPYDVATLVTDKALMRERWARDGVPIPSFFVATRHDEAMERVGGLNYPMILKPADSRGGASRGVTVVFDIEGFKDAFTFAQSFYDDKRIVVEKCVTGTEHSVDVAVIEGTIHILAVSQKEKTPYPYRVDRKVIYPADLGRNEYEALRVAVEKATKSLGIRHGIAHVELAMTADGPMLFETGARCGGGATPQIVEEHCGISELRVAVQLALGEAVPAEELRPKFDRGAVYHFFTFPAGKVKGIRGIPKTKQQPEVKDFEIFVRPGDEIKQVRTGVDRHGFAVIVAESRQKALDVSHKLETMISVIYHEEV